MDVGEVEVGSPSCLKTTLPRSRRSRHPVAPVKDRVLIVLIDLDFIVIWGPADAPAAIVNGATPDIVARDGGGAAQENDTREGAGVAPEVSADAGGDLAHDYGVELDTRLKRSVFLLVPASRATECGHILCNQCLNRLLIGSEYKLRCLICPVPSGVATKGFKTKNQIFSQPLGLKWVFGFLRVFSAVAGFPNFFFKK